MSTRREHDTLGDVAVPEDALYGAQTTRAVENFPISGLHAFPAFIRSTALVKKAAAMANAEAGRLPQELCRAIEEHLAQCHDCKVEVDTVRKTIVLYQLDRKVEVPARANLQLEAALAREYGRGGGHPPSD